MGEQKQPTDAQIAQELIDAGVINLRAAAQTAYRARRRPSTLRLIYLDQLRRDVNRDQ